MLSLRENMKLFNMKKVRLLYLKEYHILSTKLVLFNCFIEKIIKRNIIETIAY